MRCCTAARHLLKRETLAMAFQNYTPGMSESRALGFVYVDEKYAQTGRLFPAAASATAATPASRSSSIRKRAVHVVILSDATRATVVKYGGERYALGDGYARADPQRH